MKTIYISIILLASAAMIFGCSVEEAEQIAQQSQIYTMTGNTGLLTRVEYEDITNNMFCKWEIGDVVNVKASSNNVAYPFTVTEVDGNGVAKMSYKGVIPDAENFTGTATYAPKDAAKARKQAENGSTAHLKYGEVMIANLEGQKIDGTNLNFSHPSTAVYRITFKAPVDFAAGSMLTMGGAWSNPAVLELGFGAIQNDVVNAYIIYGSGQLNENGKLKFSLAVKGGDVYSYEFTSSKSITYETGKYWLANIANKTMTVAASTQEGLEAVDLGLPSGTKWANMNLGASSPESIGDLYAWGETETKESFTLENYAYAEYHEAWEEPDYIDEDGFTYPGTGQYHPEEWVYTNIGDKIYDTEYDVAHVKLGGNWSMPTRLEIIELFQYCTWKSVLLNGIAGYKVTGPNGKFIFLPTSTSYWTATSYDNSNAYYLNGDYWSDAYRYCGKSIRPVCVEITETLPIEKKAIDLGLSVKWANMNIGANRPEEYGDYFAWGETDVYDNTNQTSRWYGVDESKLMAQGVIDSKGNLTTAYDAAAVNWGGTWRMPTSAEIKELNNNCTWVWTNIRDRDAYIVGASGCTVIGPNGNRIFIPAAGLRDGANLEGAGSIGRYWSSTDDDYYYAYYLICHSSGSFCTELTLYYGMSVRPVSE